MKVHLPTNTPTAAVSGERETVQTVEKSKKSFGTELVKNIDADYKERLSNLLDKITEQGEKLSKFPTYSELRSYRNLVRDFMGEAVNRSYLMDSHMGWDGRGRQKVYSLVKKVDTELAAMTEDIRVGQERQLNIMERLGAIRGMLVDMYI